MNKDQTQVFIGLIKRVTRRFDVDALRDDAAARLSFVVSKGDASLRRATLFVMASI